MKADAVNEEEEEGLFKANAVNEEDLERDRATGVESVAHRTTEEEEEEYPTVRLALWYRVFLCFMYCKRHRFNRVPGAHRGDSLRLPSALTRTLAMPSYF